MKILFISPYYYPFIGGLEFYAKGISERLAKKGHQVSVICSQSGGAKKTGKINGVSIHRLSTFRISYRLQFWQGLAEKVKEIKPDMVFCIGHNQFYSWNAFSTAKKLKIPFFVLTYGPAAEQNSYNPIKKLLLNFYDSVITPIIFRGSEMVFYRNKSIREWCIAKQAGEFSVLPPAIDDVFFKKTRKNRFAKKFRGKKVVGFVGAICKRKGVHRLIEAIPAIREKNPDAFFVFIGPINQETEAGLMGELEKRIGELGISDSVEFMEKIDGIAEKEKLVELFDSFNVFALPSAWEGPAQTMLQAMARGKPIVVSDIPSHRGTIDGDNGFLVPLDDAGALAGKINLLLGEKELAGKIGGANALQARGYSFNRQAARLEEIIKTGVLVSNLRGVLVSKQDFAAKGGAGK